MTNDDFWTGVTDGRFWTRVKLSDLFLDKKNVWVELRLDLKLNIFRELGL